MKSFLSSTFVALSLVLVSAVNALPTSPLSARGLAVDKQLNARHEYKRDDDHGYGMPDGEKTAAVDLVAKRGLTVDKQLNARHEYKRDDDHGYGMPDGEKTAVVDLVAKRGIEDLRARHDYSPNAQEVAGRAVFEGEQDLRARHDYNLNAQEVAE